MKKRILFRFLFLLLFPAGTTVSQWNQIPDLVNVPITCMITTEDSTILVGGMMGTLLRSTDNGTTWISVWGNGVSIDTILSLGAGGGYIFVGADRSMNSVFRSSDDGLNWIASNQGLSAGQVYGFAYADTVLYAATAYGVYGSSNHGDMWRIDTVGLGSNEPYSNYVGAVQYIGTKLYASKANTASGIYRTATDTIHWERIADFSANFGGVGWNPPLAGIDTNVFAIAYGGVVMYSGSDTTWIGRSEGLPEYLSSPILSAVDSILFLYTGINNEIYVSGDLGLHWELLGTSALGNKTIESMTSTKTHVIAETSIDTWRLAVHDVVLSTGDDDHTLPIRFGLEQNFPNPFNPQTVISYRLSVISGVRLGISDVAGREVAVLVNDRKGPGEHSVIWEARDFPSGVYFVRLQAEGFTQTRKMTLLR